MVARDVMAAMLVTDNKAFLITELLLFVPPTCPLRLCNLNIQGLIANQQYR